MEAPHNLMLQHNFGVCLTARASSSRSSADGTLLIESNYSPPAGQTTGITTHKPGITQKLGWKPNISLLLWCLTALESNKSNKAVWKEGESKSLLKMASKNPQRLVPKRVRQNMLTDLHLLFPACPEYNWVDVLAGWSVKASVKEAGQAGSMRRSTLLMCCRSAHPAAFLLLHDLQYISSGNSSGRSQVNHKPSTLIFSSLVLPLLLPHSSSSSSIDYSFGLSLLHKPDDSGGPWLL